MDGQQAFRSWDVNKHPHEGTELNRSLRCLNNLKAQTGQIGLKTGTVGKMSSFLQLGLDLTQISLHPLLFNFLGSMLSKKIGLKLSKSLRNNKHKNLVVQS